MDADLLNSLIADCAVALAFVGLMASLAAVSRHAALRGAILYSVGHLGFAAGTAVFILILGVDEPFRWRTAIEFAALIASVAGAAAMIDGMARLLDVRERVKLTRIVWIIAAAIVFAALLPWPSSGSLRVASDVTNTLAMLGLAMVLVREHTPPYRLPAVIAGVAALLLAPLYFLGSLQGWLGLGSAFIPPYSSWIWFDLAVWQAINLCVMMLASFRALVVFVRLSRADPLTNVLNRNGFEDEIETRRLRHRPDTPLVVLAFDIDHFKSINDRWGHAAGDAYLVRFAEVLESCVRQSDLVARIGGEEFIAVLVNAHIDAAERVAKNILRTVHSLNVVHEDALVNTTVSIGMAEGFGVENVEALVRRADRALYAAKAGGRNQIRVAGVGETSGPMPVQGFHKRWPEGDPALRDDLTR